MQRDVPFDGLLTVVGCCLLVVTTTAVLSAPVAGQDGPNPCVGTIEEPPEGSTLVTMQGVRFADGEFYKEPGMLVSLGPEGRFEYAWNGSARGRWWAYDVDPLANGNLLLVSTEPGVSVVQELNPRTGENEWVKRFDGDNGGAPGFHPQNVTDAHDVDLINDDELLVADKGARHNRLLVYDRSAERVVWQWNFSDYPDRFPRDGGGPYARDWTHVNDVDKVAPGRYMASVRNFDQVILVDREREELVWTLGADDDHRFLNEQHNPQYLTTEDGNPSVLVADSVNDRVVEWERHDGAWTMTWELVGGGLNEPRDADRLPNGNTLVVDRKGHRTMEVTPEGRVVWEVYTPWQPYDAARYGLGDESGGPAAVDAGPTGRAELHNSASFSPAEIAACGRALAAFAPQPELLGSEVLSGTFVDHADTNTTTDPPTATPTTETDASGPGFGVGVLLAGLVVAAFVLWPRLRG
jgi:hypothetical protein